MIELKNISHHYGIKPVIRDFNLKIETGELVALMGPNGVGKSTILGIIAGTLVPIEGEIIIDNQSRRSDENIELEIRKKCVYLSDHPWLPMTSTGREFLLAMGKIYEIPDFRLMNHIDHLLEVFNLPDKADSNIYSYSNGQKKKIAICSALVVERPYIFLDEPFTGGLDPAGVVALKHVLKQLATELHITVVVATQIAEIADSLAHRIALIDKGKLLYYETLSDLKQKVGINVEQPLELALEKIMQYDTVADVDNYLKDWYK